MVGIHSQEGQPSVRGAFVRRLLVGGTAGKSAGENASRLSRRRRWSLQAAPVVTLGRVFRAGVSAVSWRYGLGAALPRVDAARCSGGLDAPGRHLSDAGTLHGLSSSRPATMAAPFGLSTAPRLPPTPAPSCAAPRPVAPCSSVRSTVKPGDRRSLPGFACIRLKLPKHAQCPSAPLLGTLGGMSHATPTTRQRTRRAPTLPTWKRCARTCPTLPSPVQPCPARPVALPVLGRMRDNLAHAVRHNGCPRYAGRAIVDSTRSAAFPLRPPDALWSPHRFELCGSPRLTAWRRASWLQARGVGHSAAGSLSPMQGQQGAQNQQRHPSYGERLGLRASVRSMRGTLTRGPRAHADREAASVQEGGDQP
jgi:hypothetical protein